LVRSDDRLLNEAVIPDPAYNQMRAFMLPDSAARYRAGGAELATSGMLVAMRSVANEVALISAAVQRLPGASSAGSERGRCEVFDQCLQSCRVGS
jgi:hypothetical protein